MEGCARGERKIYRLRTFEMLRTTHKNIHPHMYILAHKPGSQTNIHTHTQRSVHRFVVILLLLFIFYVCRQAGRGSNRRGMVGSVGF